MASQLAVTFTTKWSSLDDLVGGEQIQNGLASDVNQITPALIRTAGRNTDGHRTPDLAGPLQLQFPAGNLYLGRCERYMRPRPVRQRRFALGGKGKVIVDMLVTNSFAKRMETFTLIAIIWIGGAANGTWFEEVRTPDLPELQCKFMKCRSIARPGAGCLVRDPGAAKAGLVAKESR